MKSSTFSKNLLLLLAILLFASLSTDIALADKDTEEFALHEAAAKGNIEKVKELIAKGYDVNARNKHDWTPLHGAVQHGRKEIAEFLVANGADVNAKNHIGVTPVMLAVLGNHNDIAEMLIANGAEKTIYVAAAQGDVESTMAFLKKDPNLISALAANDGWSALHWAAFQGHPDVVKLLLENSVNVNIRDRINEVTPLFWAVFKGRLDAAKLLIDNGADVNIRMKNGRTILHTTPGTLETALLLVDNGADVNAKDDHGITPLHNIAGKGGLYTVQKVLFWKNGGTVRTRETDFEKHRNEAKRITAEIARLLINNGADVYAKDNKGKTPLDIAEQEGNKEVAELLLKHQVKNATE